IMALCLLLVAHHREVGPRGGERPARPAFGQPDGDGGSGSPRAATRGLDQGGTTVNDEQNIIAGLVGSYRFILPEIVLGVTACVIYMAGTFRAGRNLYGGLALLGLALATVALGE